MSRFNTLTAEVKSISTRRRYLVYFANYIYRTSVIVFYSAVCSMAMYIRRRVALLVSFELLELSPQF